MIAWLPERQETQTNKSAKQQHFSLCSFSCLNGSDGSHHHPLHTRISRRDDISYRVDAMNLEARKCSQATTLIYHPENLSLPPFYLAENGSLMRKELRKRCKVEDLYESWTKWGVIFTQSCWESCDALWMLMKDDRGGCLVTEEWETFYAKRCNR